MQPVTSFAPTAADPGAGVAAAPRGDPKRLREEAERLASVFMKHLLGAMRKGMPENPYVGRGAGSQAFLQMLDDEYGDILSRHHGGLGISDLLVRQLERHGAPPAGAPAIDAVA